MSRARACWRLARVGLHLVAGLLVCVVVLPVVSPAGRDKLHLRWSKQLLAILGVRLTTSGAPIKAGLITANHISWLDVFLINAHTPATFVCKADVARWPLLGTLVKKSGTLFIERNKPRAAAATAKAITALLNQGKSVAIFPEGTTTDGAHVLPFRSALIEAAIEAQAPLQPVALMYSSRAAHFVGDISLWRSLCAIARSSEITATLHFLPAVDTAHASRGLLAENARSRIMRRLPGMAAETPADLPAAKPSAPRPTGSPNPASPAPAVG